MIKIGNSIDIHRLVPGEYIRIGGVDVPSKYSSISYSDGDALMHAVTESILGALGLGDLGDNYPNDDPKYKGINSELLLIDAKNKMEQLNYHISNIDIMIVLESTKLRDYKKIVEHNLARILQIDSSKINLKAGTNEKIGSIGDNESYLVWASTLLEEN